VIRIERRDGRPLRIGHRGAAALVAENTIRSFRKAVELGVDLVELDVFELRGRELVVAHSDDLREVSHGAHDGSVRERSLASLRELCPELPTLEEALAFFAEEARDTGVHLDLKVRGREGDVVDLLDRLGLRERSLVSTFDFRSARVLARASAGVLTGITIPRSAFGITETGRGALVARTGLAVLRRLMPVLARPALAFSHGHVLVLHHAVVGAAAVRRAHARGAPVVAWTVDDPRDLARVDAAGVDAIVTNDPTMFASTLET
jgi:glycerophosphoryl diester phosphodiesterase